MSTAARSTDIAGRDAIGATWEFRELEKDTQAAIAVTRRGIQKPDEEAAPCLYPRREEKAWDGAHNARAEGIRARFVMALGSVMQCPEIRVIP